MGDLPGLELTYEHFWGERKDLKPPSKVEVIHGPRRESIPFSVDIDQAGLEKFLHDEGVLGGSETRIVFEYPNVTPLTTKELGATLLSRSDEEFAAGVENWFHSKNKEPRLGWAKNVPNRLNLAVINVTSCYNVALATSPESGGQFQENFKKTLATVTAHEIEHLRQPFDPASGIHIDKATMKRGMWAFIDGARRIVYPWLGTAEPVALLLEHDLASVIAHSAYSASDRERGARSTAKINGPLLEQVIQTPVRDENQLKQHYFWDKLRGLGRDTKQLLDEVRAAVKLRK